MMPEKKRIYKKKKDLHFFLGTIKQYHYFSHNPFIIIGAFYPPMPPLEQQMALFDS